MTAGPRRANKAPSALLRLATVLLGYDLGGNLVQVKYAGLGVSGQTYADDLQPLTFHRDLARLLYIHPPIATVALYRRSDPRD